MRCARRTRRAAAPTFRRPPAEPFLAEGDDAGTEAAPNNNREAGAGRFYCPLLARRREKRTAPPACPTVPRARARRAGNDGRCVPRCAAAAAAAHHGGDCCGCRRCSQHATSRHLGHDHRQSHSSFCCGFTMRRHSASTFAQGVNG